MVAETTRTSTLMVSVPPTRSNSRSCSARSSLICTSIGRSPTSSRNSVPPSASSKRPGRRAHRAGEGALLVAEQLALEHAGRERRAVDAHERLVLARRVDVDGVRDQLLAGAGLAAQEHRRAASARPARPWPAPRAAPALSPMMLPKSNAPCISLVQVAGVLARAAPSSRAFSRRRWKRSIACCEDAAHLLGVPRLGDVAVDLAEVDRLDQHVDVGERGEDDADRVGPDAARASRSSSRPVIFGMRWSVTITATSCSREDRRAPRRRCSRSGCRTSCVKLKRKASRLSCSSSTTRIGYRFRSRLGGRVRRRTPGSTPVAAARCNDELVRNLRSLLR